MSATPHFLSGLKVPKFKKFLSSRGAMLLKTTNEWEVIRCSIRGETAVLYKNKRGELKWHPLLVEAYKAYVNCDPWSGLDGEKTKNRIRRSVVERSIEDRDGVGCFYCGHIPKDDDDPLTVEHMLEVSKGGTNHLFNLVLACSPCNQTVAGLSISEKVKYRDRFTL